MGDLCPDPNTRSSPKACGSGTAIPRRWTTSTSPCRTAWSTACSARTARARRRPSGSSRPCSGRAGAGPRSPGYDVQEQARLVRRRIGLTGQHPAIDDSISARQNLVMFGRLFHIGRPRPGNARTNCWPSSGWPTWRDKAPKKFSGGMRRRLDLASSMILAPEVLFLDEPTTGLDPAGRQEVWQAVGSLAAGGTTVLLTTHYLDEADRLCDRIGVIDHGRNVVEDTPDGLKRRIGEERLEVVAAEPGRPGGDRRGTRQGRRRRPGVHCGPIHADGQRGGDRRRTGAHRRGGRTPQPWHRRGRPRAAAADPGRGVPAPDRPHRRRRNRKEHNPKNGTGSAT